MSRIRLTEFECELACGAIRAAIDALVKLCEVTKMPPAVAARIILDDPQFEQTVRHETEKALEAIAEREKGRPS